MHHCTQQYCKDFFSNEWQFMEFFKHAIVPWCVGSIFPSPQLMTGVPAEPLGPILFDKCGTERVLSTGFPLQYSFIQSIQKPSVQVKEFLKSHEDAFFPLENLVSYLQEDVSLNIAMATNNNQLYGNRLQGIKCGEGVYQLFFPVGENMDQIGSITFSSVNVPCIKQSDNMQYPRSSSVCQPILQIAAQAEINGEDECAASLAVRTSYQIHWLTAHTKDKHTSFDSRAVANFELRASHVSWNPYLPYEAAVVFDNGMVRLFDLNSGHNGGSVFATNLSYVRPVIPRSESRFLKQTNMEKPMTGSVDIGGSLFENRWWHCEYSWHPRTLLVAGCKEVCLFDMRDNPRGRQDHGSCTVANASYIRGLGICNQVLKEDCFGGFARADHDGMYQFATASKQHLLLFDVRKPLTPVLQWEHGMRESPRLLFMCPLSALRPCFEGRFRWSSGAGSVILAVACQSGDTHAFCYGPKPPNAQPNWESVENTPCHMRSDLDHIMYSWELPSKVVISKECSTAEDSVLNSTRAITTSIQRKAMRVQVENVVGLYICPGVSFPTLQSGHNNDQPGFNMLQLTGSGAILVHRYRVSRNIDRKPSEAPPKPMPLIVIPEKVKLSTCHYMIEPLPAFLAYIREGSVCPVYLPNNSAFGKEWAVNESGAVADLKEIKEVDHGILVDSKIRGIYLEVAKLITIPVSIYEISHKVLWRSLARDLSSVAAETRKDHAVRRRYYTGLDFPQIFPPSKSHSLLVDASDLQADDMDLKNESMNSIYVGPVVPLPVVLEIEELQKVNTAPTKSNLKVAWKRNAENGNIRHADNTGMCTLNWPSGYNKLIDGYGRIRQIIEVCHENLLSEESEYAVSLGDSLDLWSNNGTECKGKQNAIFHCPTMRLPFSSTFARTQGCCSVDDGKGDKILICNPRN
eukprot:c23725_g1_i2 orf=564-3305(+)